MENNGLRMKNEFIEKELKNVATDYNTTVMAIDVKEKELIGVTDKNKKFGKEEIQLTLEKLLQVISSTEEGKVMWFVYDGTVITSVDMNYDDDIILIGIDTGFSVMDDLWMTMLRMVGFSIVIYIIVIAFFNYLIKKLIFEDIEKNKAKIQKIMSGEHDIEFETCKVEEIEELVSTIKQLNHGYIHKTERMNKMFNSISPNIATFELLDENYASFFSDNFECVLGISTEEGHNFRTNAAEFESFITELSKQKDENGMVHFRDKYLKINLFEIADKEKIGVIIDRTNDEEIRRNLEHELKEEQKKNSLDPLTGIMNRKGFRDMVEKLLAHEQEGVLFIFDLDNFKKINDTKGHPEGDKVLRMFAKMLRQEFRKSDLVARIGGDEFMVYIPNQIEDSLMRKKLDSLLYNTQKNYSIYKDYHISVSIGVARINKEAGIADFNSLYETADIALYIAKGLGKNQYYVNKQSIRCVRKECIGCTEGCPRSKILLADKAQ